MSESNPVDEGAAISWSVRQQRGTKRIVHEIRYTTTEWEAITEAARVYGKTPFNFVRETSLGALPSGQSTLGNAPLIRELGRSGTALARLVATAQATGALPEAAILETVLAELLAVVRRLGQPTHRRAHNDRRLE